MKTFREEDLIAYHLGELSWWKGTLLRRRLKVDAGLAAESEEIAATLRAFSSDAVPEISEAALERSWHRVRRSFSVLDAPPRSRRVWMWAAASASVVAVIAIVVINAIPRIHTVQTSIETAQSMCLRRGTGASGFWRTCTGISPMQNPTTIVRVR